MPIDARIRFQEEKRKLSSLETKKRLSEPLRAIRKSAVIVVSLTSESPPEPIENRLKPLLDEMLAASEEFRSETEKYIAGTLALAETAALAWEESWEAAFKNPALDRVKEAELLRFVLDDCSNQLKATLQSACEHNGMFDKPLARLDELEAKAAEFPLFARECLARWEMLDRPAPSLDRDRIAKAQEAYARGEYEYLDDVLTRIQSGGLWEKE